MRWTVGIVLVLSFASCGKQTAMMDIREFQGRYLTCDSIRTIVDDIGRVTVKGRGTGLDVKFDSTVYTIYSTPVKKFTYFIRNSKIYYYPPGNNSHDGDYLRINFKSGNQLRLEYREPLSGNKTLYYYTSI